MLTLLQQMPPKLQLQNSSVKHIPSFVLVVQDSGFGTHFYALNADSRLEFDSNGKGED
jgi:hypothetical protein